MTRSLMRYLTGALDTQQWKGLIRSPSIYADWAETYLCRYFFGIGTYPTSIRVKTPSGIQPINAYSPYDLWTINEIFCWGCYAPSIQTRTFVDLGGNIGVSALYFLTRSPDIRGYVFEPLDSNVEKAVQNLKDYEAQVRVIREAVYTHTGEVEFSVERTGRYSGIGLPLGERVRVKCREINEALDQALSELAFIDVLKIDIEGAETEILPAIEARLLARIRFIVVEGADASYRNLQQAGFQRESLIKGVYRYTRGE